MQSGLASTRAARIAEGIESIQRAELVGAGGGTGGGAPAERASLPVLPPREGEGDKTVATTVPLGQGLSPHDAPQLAGGHGAGSHVMREGPIEAEDDLDDYFRNAGSWADDRAADIRRSRRVAWWVAGAMGFIAVLEAIALVALTPLKTVEPYTLLVDKQTGYVEALTPVDGNLVTPDAALTRSFLAQYVIARESFAIDTVQQEYRKVALWSAEGARSGYIAGMQAGNPDSPLTRYPRGTVIDTQVKSISSLGDNVSLVRFDTVRTAPGGGGEVRQPYAAVVRWRYSGDPMSVEDRMLNPLGFQVTRYRKDAEALPAVAEPAPATPLQRVEDEASIADEAAGRAP